MNSAKTAERPRQRGEWRRPRFWIGIGISVFFLVFMARSMDGAKLLAALRTMELWYLVPAIALTLASYYCRAYRWKLLLMEEKNAAMANLFSATALGYMANNLLPARLGELLRVYVLGEKEGINKGGVFASLVLDRLFDGFSVLLILLITLFTVRFPGTSEGLRGSLVAGGCITVALYLLLVGFLVLLKVRTAAALRLAGRLLKPLPARFSENVLPLLGSFIGGIRLSRRPAILLGILASSAVIWLTAVWPIDLTLRSFGIVLPFSASLFILVLLVIAVMVPASPGYIGTYHFACFSALAVFGITGEQAFSIALIIHGINFFPITLIGLFYLLKGKMRLSRMAVSGE
jgi:glycosyltransferase 2 family protein